MVDWLVIWGVAQAAGFAFKPILEDLSKESAKDYAKDFFKDCLKKVIRLPEKDAQKEAYGKALKEFLQLVQQELEDADYQDTQIEQYTQPLRKFITQETVAAVLGSAFEENCRGLDTQALAKIWIGLNLPYLPEDFNWERVSKRYLRKVRAIVHESEKLRPIFEAQSQATVAEGMQELVGIAPAFDLERYAEGLREQYGNLKLESLDTTGVYYSELKLWRMFVPQNVRECQEFLPQVYEIPKEHGRRLRQSGQLDEAELAEAELEQYRRVYVEQPIRSVLEVVGDPMSAERPLNPPILGDLDRVPPKVGGAGGQQVRYAVILGDPGSGKSTLLQYMALVWAERPLSELPLYPIPLLIELRSYARDKQTGQCPDILAFIHSGNITCRLNQQQLHEKLRAGQAIALFDGIDEVFDPILRDRVVTDIHRFTNDYPTVQVIVTSRWLGYKAQRLRDAEFRHFMLQDLEEEQVEAFIQRWHDLTFLEGADKQRKRERLQKAIRDSKAIRELAGNPLLLTMMAILNRNQELPRDRPELYNQASRVLLHQWDVERALIEDYRLDPKTIDYRDKQAMLRKVAYHMQSSEKELAGNIISATDLENILTEYLRGIEVEQPRTIARLMIHQLRTRNFILCYLGADSYAFVHRTFLEYFCAWEFVWRFEKEQFLTEEQLKTEIIGNRWQDTTWHEVIQLICGMLSELIASRIIDYLIEQDGNLKDFENIFLADMCILELRTLPKIENIRTKIFEKLVALTQYTSAKSLTLSGLLKDPKYKERLNTLQQKIDNYEFDFSEEDVNLEEFSEEERIDYELVNSIIDVRFAEDYIRSRAIKAVAQHYKDISDTLPLLKKCFQDNEISAIDELIQGWRDDPEIFCLLKKKLKHSDNKLMRQILLRKLAKGWKDDPDTLLTLKNYAQYDEDEDVRSAGLEALVHTQRDNPEMFEFLYNRALHDPFERKEDWQINPRRIALDAILKNYSDRPQTLELLHDRAQNDPDEQVRKFAREKLAELEEQK